MSETNPSDPKSLLDTAKRRIVDLICEGGPHGLVGEPLFMDTNQTNDKDIIIVPPEVEAILDEATGATLYSAIFTPVSVQLVETVGHAVVKEVFWKDAGRFGANLRLNLFDQDIRATNE